MPASAPAGPGILACLGGREVKERRIGPKTISAEWALEGGWSTLLDHRDGPRHELVIDGWAVDLEHPRAPMSLVALRHGHPVDFRCMRLERPDVDLTLGMRTKRSGFKALVPCRRPEDVRLHLVSHARSGPKVQELPSSPPAPAE